MPTRPFVLGRARPLGAPADAPAVPFVLPAHHLVTHGVVVGMTGSGKTGLAVVLVEEALRSRVPTLVVDVKGDLADLALAFPRVEPEAFEPWVDADAAARDGTTPRAVAESLAARARAGLAEAGLGDADVAAYVAQIAPRILTPGSTAGEPVNVLSALESPSARWTDDEEGARESLAAAVSLLLRLLGRDADAARSREHVLLSTLAERRLRRGEPAGLAELLADLASPPIATVGAMSLDDFLAPRERQSLAQDLNTLLASPSFAAWRRGAAMDVGAWLRPRDARTPLVIVSVAHLDEGERQVVLGLLFEQVLAWVRTLAGTTDLRALVVFDEVYGFLPPHPANPPSKRPLLALLKQARAFGVGLVVATQNPMDLDYKAVSNAGAWFVGRLQTDADRERVVEGLARSDAGPGLDAAALGATLKSLPPRTFLVRDVHASSAGALLETRWTIAWLRGPLTRSEIRRLAARDAASDAAPTPAPAPASVPRAPEGWKTLHGHAPAGATRVRYAPWIAATVRVELRDARLGVARDRTATLAAPLGDDGLPDLARAVEVPREYLGAAPATTADYARLPEALAKKPVAQAAVRAMREHAGRALAATVRVHRALGLASEAGESEPAFEARCREEAQRRCEHERADAIAKSAPKLARLAERLEVARAELGAAETHRPTMGDGLAAAAVGLVSSTARRSLERGARRAGDRFERARRAFADADAALREAVAVRDAALSALDRDAALAPDAIETRAVAPRRGGVEVAEVALAWAGAALEPPAASRPR